ncbi:unnamed protein product [Paramecium pentaurelia]|uniref:Transmembrane protein n=1 Tax=Paramecium pentaurelia TaxID=43138 RepID=A0A8S1YH89_9CILI|nr:unnamed protein product [Paramecium pentaurelia]
MTTSDTVFLLISWIFINISIPKGHCCPYNDYEQALLSVEFPFEKNFFEAFVILEVGDSFGFGFWSLCIPQQTFKNIPYVEKEFLVNDDEIGQLLFLVKGSTSNSVLGFVQIDYLNLLVYHTIIILGSTVQVLRFDYQPKFYKGQWILNVITFNFNDGKIIIQMTDQMSQSGTMNIGQDYIQIIQGGRGNIENFNLNIFKGRLSKIFVNKVEYLGQDLFQYMSDLCQVPRQKQDEQIVYFVKDLQIFEGDTSLQYTVNQFGNKFCLSGWIKYDTSKVIQNSIQPVIRISLFKNYSDREKFGDEIFLMQVYFNKLVPSYTQIIINQNYHNIPIMGHFANSDLISIYSHLLYDMFSDLYYQGLQQWHFVKYEYGSSIAGRRSLLQIQFFNQLNVQEISSDISLPTNSPYYVYLGSDEFVNELLWASIFDFKFEYNYFDDKILLFNACHYSCLTCDGPLQNNCISCEPGSNRQYLNEQKKCQCLNSYIEISGETVCQSFEYKFSSVELLQRTHEMTQTCQFGYFIFPNEQGQIDCLKCPQSNYIDILCVDCIYYPLIWYLKPICKIDLISYKLTLYDAYKYSERDQYDYDFNLIDQNRQLLLKSGYLEYCDQELDSINCFQANDEHLGQTIYVRCKPNYYQLNGDCLLTNINCLQASIDGSCQKVKDGFYLHDGNYYNCPIYCLTCIYNIDSNILQCQSCIDHSALNDGSCLPCGNYCSTCLKYYDKNINRSYLKCYKCIDESKYFFSFDGINCQENTINYCDYAFQAMSYDYQINTLDLYFTPRDDWNNIITTCGRCKYGYVIILDSQLCLRMQSQICYFSYAKYVITDSIDFATLEYKNDDGDYYQTPNGLIINTAADDYGFYFTSQQYCLIYEDYSQASKIIQFSQQCPGLIENCATCLRERVLKWSIVHICLECKSGYYAERISGKCYQCPSELHCYNCGQQQKLSKDYWKIQIRAFYQIAINFDNNHPFKLYAQSEEKDDYEIFCTMCIKGYELLDQKCIKVCPESCLECQYINGENQCIRCEMDQQGRKLSLYDNQCIPCPKNCGLCRIRSQDEISIINPLFNNQNYFMYTYQCLKSYEDQDYYYDQELGNFIQCSNGVSCEQQIIIPINLYCTQQDFIQTLNEIQSTYQKHQFKQQNILLQDLTSGNSFKEFENHDFYLSANSMLIKTIIINVVSVKPQICRIYGNATILQIFSENIFSTINVELNIFLNQNTIIEFERTINFQNFNKITIQGAQFKPIQNNKLKQIIFQSKLPQTIILDNFNYKQISQENDQSKFIFNDIKNLELINFKIEDLVQNIVNIFILIGETSYTKIIKLQSFGIFNSIFLNQITLFFNLNKNDIIQIENLQVFATFQNSTLIHTSLSKQFGSLVAQTINLQVDVLNCLTFLNLYLFQKVTIYGLKFQNSIIKNSTLMILNNSSQIHELIFKVCKFRELSYGVVNSDQLQLSNSQIEFFNVIIEQNEYHQTTKFLLFDKYNNVNSKIQIRNILISNNYVSFISPEFQLNTYTSCLIYISFDYINILELNLIRGVGLIDISIVEAKSLRIESSKITQVDEFKFLGLHQYIDCQLQQVQGEYYLQSLLVTSVLYFEIIDMQIKSTYSYNSPIIYYKSSDKVLKQQFEVIHFQNFIVESNLQLLSNQKYQTAIIFIDSIQQTTLKLLNITFLGNILHEYFQNSLQISSLLLNINCILGIVNITNSKFLQNTVYNSTDTIIYIKSQKLVLLNCTFYQNSYFNYQLIQPYLLWGFLESEEVSYEQINQIFQVKSTSGVAQILVENLEIQFCYFQQSVGFSGGALLIEAQKDSVIQIQYTTFKDLSTTYSQELGFGGAIYLDGTSTQSLEVSFYQIQIQNITAKESGGFIYILSDSPKVTIKFQKLNIQNVFAKFGSILHVTFSFASQVSQSVNLKSVVIQNKKEGFINFLNKYTQISKTEEIAIINNRVLFYIHSASNIVIQNITISNSILESILQINYALSVSIQNFQISNSIISKFLFKLNSKQYLYNTIQISGLIISNITVSLQLKRYSCQQQNYQEQTIFFKCIQNFKNSKAPLNLFSQSIQQITYGDCLLSQILQQSGQENNFLNDNTQSGMLLFLDLTDSSQIKLDNILFSKIDCKFCQYGLIYQSFLKVENLLMKQCISELKITNSSCGINGCFYIFKESSNSFRLLNNQEMYLQSLNFEIFIDNYICQFNRAQNGTCLIAENIRVLIKDSIFQFNHASETGGAILVKMKQDVFIINSWISNNEAQIGGGIYLINQQDMDYQSLGTIFINNQAGFFGNDKASEPQKLTITFDDENSKLQTLTIEKTQDSLIQQVIDLSLEDVQKSYFFLPSGQRISHYKYFSQEDRSYYPFNYKFRLMALSKDNSVIKNLKNSYCEIESRILNTSNINDQQLFSNNLTNMQNISFNESTQDYNLDDFIVYFDNALPSEIVLSLQFKCNSIIIPIYNSQYPFNQINHHSNYKLRVNIKTLNCQYGEIKNNSDFSCVPCNSDQGLFSLKLNSQKCEYKDDISTISVESALLNLKFGYWRPYFQSNIVNYCINQPENCLGGWQEGNDSCFLGHIGALCEQCDLYNTRGDGEYSMSQKYACGSCQEKQKNVIIIICVSIWTLISILVSVQSNLKTIEKFVKIISIIFLGLTVQQTNNQSGILIKMLTNYLQIISQIATFQLKFPSGFQSTINTVGSPIQSMIYSLDCFLSHIFTFEIQYGRMIWQIIIPFIYIIFFFLCYYFAVKFKFATFNRSVITTTLIYMYIYLHPSLIGGFVQLISYREISGYKWIQSNVSQRFDTPDHEKWMIRLCLPMLVVLAIIIPISFFYNLYSNSHQLNDKKVRLQWGYLYNEYTKTAYFWEVIKISQKELMIIFLTYYEDSIILKATLISLILGVYLELSLKYKPYNLNSLNKLDQYSTNVCLASIALAIGIYVSEQSNQQEIQIPYVIIISSLNLHITYKLISKILVEYLKEKISNIDENLDKLRQFIRNTLPFLNNIAFMRRILADRSKQRNRVALLYNKLKQFLLPQAKQIIIFKNYQLQIARQKYSKQNIATLPLSLGSPVLAKESNQLIKTSILDSSLHYSKNTITTFVIEKIKQNRVDQMAEIFHNQIQRSQKATPNLQSEKYIKDDSEE